VSGRAASGEGQHGQRGRHLPSQSS
jgi:hypothetical protein